MNLEKLTHSLCFQCNRCSSGCPTAHYMDYKPAQIIHLIRMNQTEKVLKSEAVWYCILCETCTARCPQGVDIARLMSSVKSLVSKSGFVPQFNNMFYFSDLFTKNVRNNGCLNELTLALAFKIKTKDFFSDIKLGMDMLKRGRLPVFKLPKNASTVKRLIKRCSKLKV